MISVKKSDSSLVKDVRVIKLSTLVFLLVASFSFEHVVLAQDVPMMEVADAFGPTQKNADKILRYKGMPELKAPLPQLNYPEQAIQMAVEGRVIVSYTINKEGKVIRAEVMRGIGYGCDEEALRVIKNASFKPVLDEHGNPTV